MVLINIAIVENQKKGRFQDDFVESRRVALERCLQKIVAHPMLYGDPDLKVFLESESFNVEVVWPNDDGGRAQRLMWDAY